MQDVPFDPLKYADADSTLTLEAATKIAKQTRDTYLRALRKAGIPCKGWRLTGQLRKWAALGIPDGRVRTVYYVTKMVDTSY